MILKDKPALNVFINGWALVVNTTDHSDDDVIKKSYTAVHWDGRRAAVQWSPYGPAPTALDFLNLITGQPAAIAA